MRRITALCAAGIFVAIAACGGENEDGVSDTSADTEAAEEEEEEEEETPDETDAPPETDAPADTAPPTATDAPAETDAPIETDAPAETDPPSDDLGLVDIPEWDADTVARVTTALLGAAENDPIDIEAVAAYVNGTPDLSAAGLGLAGFAATRVPTADLAFDTDWPETWTIQSDFDAAYSQNIAEQTVAVAIFDGDPAARPGSAGVSFFGTQPGFPTIGTTDQTPFWLAEWNVFTEYTIFAGTETLVLFGLGNGNGFDPFGSPSWFATVDSAAGHAAVIVAPYELGGTAVFDAPNLDAATATAEVSNDVESSDVSGVGPDVLDETWIAWSVPVG